MYYKSLVLIFCEVWAWSCGPLGSFTGLKPEFNVGFGNAGFKVVFLLFLSFFSSVGCFFWILLKSLGLFCMVTHQPPYQLAGDKAVQAVKASVALLKVRRYSINVTSSVAQSHSFSWRRKCMFGAGLGRLSALLQIHSDMAGGRIRLLC